MIAAGAQAVVVAPPYYHMNSQQELLTYYRDLAAALPVPVIAYNVPVLVKTPWSRPQWKCWPGRALF